MDTLGSKCRRRGLQRVCQEANAVMPRKKYWRKNRKQSLARSPRSPAKGEGSYSPRRISLGSPVHIASRSSNVTKASDGSLIYKRNSLSANFKVSGPARESPAAPARKRKLSDRRDSKSGLSPAIKRRKSAKSLASGEDEPSDAYCWLCHKEGNFVCCELCPRVYHTKCLGIVKEPAGDWVCPECERIMRAECADTQSKAMARINVDKLCSLLTFAIGRMKHEGSEPFEKPVDTRQVPTYMDYVIYPMDFSLLEKNIKKKMYGSTEAFLADTKWILHNCIIFNGVHHKLTANAKLIVKICRHEMTEIEVCPECYMSSCLKKDENWFCEPCDPPHPLVWAKMKGYPFWPAKVLREVSGQVDVRFFGEHDRAWVPSCHVFLLSEESPTSTKTKKGGFGISMEEVHLHIEQIRERYGSFQYAPFRSQYDSKNPYKLFTSGTTSSKSSSTHPGSRDQKSGRVKRALSKIVGDKPRSMASKTATAVKSKYSSIITTRRAAATAKLSSPSSSSSEQHSHIRTRTSRLQSHTRTRSGLVLGSKQLSSGTGSEEDIIMVEPHSKSVAKSTSQDSQSTVDKDVVSEEKSVRDNNEPISEVERLLTESTLPSDLSSKSDRDYEAKDASGDCKTVKPPITADGKVTDATLQSSSESHAGSEAQSETSCKQHDAVDVDTETKHETETKPDTSDSKPHTEQSTKLLGVFLPSQGKVHIDLTKIAFAKPIIKEPDRSVHTKSDDVEQKGHVAEVTEVKDTETVVNNSCLESKPAIDVTVKGHTDTTMEASSSGVPLSDSGTKVASSESELDSGHCQDLKEISSCDQESNKSCDVRPAKSDCVISASKTDRPETPADHEEKDKSDVIDNVSAEVKSDDGKRSRLGNQSPCAVEKRGDQSTGGDGTLMSEQTASVNDDQSVGLQTDDQAGKTDSLPEVQEASTDNPAKPAMPSQATAAVLSQPAAPVPSQSESKVSPTQPGSGLNKHFPDLVMEVENSESDSGSERLVIDETSAKENRSTVVPSGGERLLAEVKSRDGHLKRKAERDEDEEPCRKKSQVASSDARNIDGATRSPEPVGKLQDGGDEAQPSCGAVKPDSLSSSLIQHSPTQTDTPPEVTSNDDVTPDNSNKSSQPSSTSDTAGADRTGEVCRITSSTPDINMAEIDTAKPEASSSNTTPSPDSATMHVDSNSSEGSAAVSQASITNVTTAESSSDVQTTTAPPGEDTGDAVDDSFELPDLDIGRYSDKLVNSLRGTLEDMCRDLIQNETGAAVKKHYRLQVERLRWRHKQELAELQHNAALTLAEMRISLEKMIEKSIESTKKTCEAEKTKAVEEAKKKQWCAQCGKEAIFYCCWNTSYCDYPCQQAHWPQHMAHCTQGQTSNGQQSTESPASKTSTQPEPAKPTTYATPSPKAPAYSNKQNWPAGGSSGSQDIGNRQVRQDMDRMQFPLGVDPSRAASQHYSSSPTTPHLPNSQPLMSGRLVQPGTPLQVRYMQPGIAPLPGLPPQQYTVGGSPPIGTRLYHPPQQGGPLLYTVMRQQQPVMPPARGPIVIGNNPQPIGIVRGPIYRQRNF